MEQLINNSTITNNGYWFTSRIFGCYTSYVSFAFSGIGIFVGIEYLN